MELIEEGDDGEQVNEAYVLTPMNCPHHHKIFSSQPRSYRDLKMLNHFSHSELACPPTDQVRLASGFGGA